MNSIERQQQEQKLSAIMSLYIPRIHCKYTAENVMNYFHVWGVGNVKRVDFLPIENVTNMQSAFVHFHTIYINILTDHLAEKLITENGSFKIQVTTSEYWIVMRNKKPIIETTMNIHQMAAYIKEIEEKVEKQATALEKQEAQIKELSNMVTKLVERYIYV